MRFPIRGWKFGKRLGLVVLSFFFFVATPADPLSAQTPDERIRQMRRELQSFQPRPARDIHFARFEHQWDGVISNDDLLSVLGERAIIDNRTDWQNVWTSWRPDQPLPAIDFDVCFVFVLIAQGPNIPRLQPLLARDDGGDITIVAESTLIGGPGFGYCLLQIPRAGIHSVNGNPVESVKRDDNESMPVDEAQVSLTGIVETGAMAIGGETTGVTVTAGDIKMELEFVAHPELAKAAEALNGRRARISGSLRVQQAVETPDRWIIDVAEIQPLKD